MGLDGEDDEGQEYSVRMDDDIIIDNSDDNDSRNRRLRDRKEPA